MYSVIVQFKGGSVFKQDTVQRETAESTYVLNYQRSDVYLCELKRDGKPLRTAIDQHWMETNL